MSVAVPPVVPDLYPLQEAAEEAAHTSVQLAEVVELRKPGKGK